MARRWQANDAVRERVPLLVGVIGPSGSGKTFSALRLARGMQEIVGGEIYGVDTESRRMLAYADHFRFKHVPFDPPFGSLDYLEVLRWCAAQGAKTIIVDSITHEHVGQGGYLETAEAAIRRIARVREGEDVPFKDRQKFGMLGWAEASPRRTKLIEGMKQIGANIILCSRARDKSKPAGKGAGRDDEKIIHLGMQPIANDDLLYEMTCNVLLMPRANGVPTWRSEIPGEVELMKLPEQFRHVFANGQPLDEQAGRLMAEWAAGGPAPKLVEGPKRNVIDALREVAPEGRVALGMAIADIAKNRPDLMPKVEAHRAELERIADEANGPDNAGDWHHDEAGA